MEIKKCDRVLIVAPHADDETIGAGGLLSKYGKQGDVWLITDGRKGNTPDAQYSEDELITVRKKEFKSAMSFFNVHDYTFFELTDGNASSEISGIYNKSIKEYNYIFIPNQYEKHPDHVAAYKALIKMKKRQRAKGDIVEYEVWTPLTAPNFLLPITDVMDNKLKALSYYESQLKTFDYCTLAESLNRYRGLTGNEKYCEAFFSHRKNNLKRKNRIASALPKPLVSGLSKILHK